MALDQFGVVSYTAPRLVCQQQASGHVQVADAMFDHWLTGRSLPHYKRPNYR